MGKWLRKAGRATKKLIQKVAAQEELQQVAQQVVSSTNSSLQDLQTKGQECATYSRECIDICESTAEKREQMIAFASEIQSTLTNLSQDASALETIQQLTDGSKVRQAMELAKGLDQAALQCVDKSIQMMDTMEDGMELLPEMVQSALEKIANDDDDDDDEDDVEDQARALLNGLEQDFQDVKTCINAIQNLNLTTAIKVGVEAFTQLYDKAKRSKSLFITVQEFAQNVYEITQTFSDMKVSEFTSKGRDMLECLSLCDVMRQVAQGAGKLLQILIQLFEMTADRVSELWSALAFAKECMQDSVEIVERAKTLCTQAKTKSQDLITTSRSIHDKLHDIGSINRESIQAVRALVKGGEIESAIDLVRNMDDEVVACADGMTQMVQKVEKGFANFPPILTQGMDMRVAGRQDDDPEPLDVEQDVRELDEARVAIEESEVVTVIVAGRNGFKGVSEKSATCKDTLALVEEFSGTCRGAIDSFVSVWDVESAMGKVVEMCRLVNLGELMKQFSEQVKKLLLSILALLKAALDKFQNGIPDFPENVNEAIGAAKEGIEDAVDAVKDQADEAVDFVKDKIKDKLKIKKFW